MSEKTEFSAFGNFSTEPLNICVDEQNSLFVRRLYRSKDDPVALMSHGIIENGRIFYSKAASASTVFCRGTDLTCSFLTAAATGRVTRRCRSLFIDKWSIVRI
jgi:hypothetical protein